MPALTPLDGLTYADVRPGDSILGSHVVSTRSGTKWVYLTYAGQRSEARFDPKASAPISRMLPTEEERAAADRQVALETLDYLEVADRRNAAQHSARIVQEVTAGRFPSWDALERLAVLVPQVELWDVVANRHYRTVLLALDDAVDSEDARACAEDAPGRVEVARTVAAEALERATSYLSLGGSSSPATRLQEDGQRVGRIEWARMVQSLPA